MTAAITSAAPDPVEADIAWVAQGGFCEPETVLALPDDTLLVSNVCDFRQRGNGFLSLLDAQGQALDWRILEGLDAPSGMAMASRYANTAVRFYQFSNHRLRGNRGMLPVNGLWLRTGWFFGIISGYYYRFPGR